MTTEEIAPPRIAVDVAVLTALLGDDDPVLIRELLQVFARSAAAIAPELTAACIAGNAKEVATLAHKLKSPARTLGALALGDCCAALEAAGAAHAVTEFETLLAQFAVEMTAVETTLAELMMQSTA
ncbi:Hpt domain-containing protein [Chromatium okenii]|jgi:HPt (histidine-containing phosphotransfer) domain-containing protein|uniref:HPt domain-containing protein n=1 Tax=Chromatium okenii TaxID=61644 RepID=A0A2S7XQ98_9GAMM|nr:Hpt domain-containing protein [Chromatium okenii]MBV5307808.1 Hpt domain-containing protein [Chromatium okenii]PQJ95885.1 hypothetical protein CXB77_08330 [Chromatium okenii]